MVVVPSSPASVRWEPPLTLPLTRTLALTLTLIHSTPPGEMGEAAAAQLEAVRSELTNLEPTSDEARALGSISSDLDLFVEQSAKQRGKVRR